ncbi:aldo/keto reductase [Geobacillus sp. E263]|uniref:aldo/keto reductase n=1 Tax=Geobacillus sp. E263 TaxID=391290 RepID=UPI001179C91C|nr:aldo/keto reductase [Geobacillus sp. E263]
MQKRRIGLSDLYVSEIGLGCMSLGTDEKKAIRIIHEALERGINYLDTADLYDRGLNEEFVGKAIKGKRDQVILATKVGNRWEDGKDGWFWDPSKKYIKSEVKESLRRLQTDYIDLYQLHGGTIDDPIDETIEAFEELKQEGVIRYYGISSIRPNVIREYVKRSNIVSVMMQYSLLDRRPEEWFPLLREHNISVIARGPVAKGLLTERPLEAASDSVKKNGYLDYTYEELQTLLPKLKAKTAEHRSFTATALQFCLYDPVVAAIIPGASSVEQLIENINAASAPRLTEEEYEWLRQHTKSSVYEMHR